MGNTEGIPGQKFKRNIKTSDTGFSTDTSKVARDRDMTENSSSVDGGTETIDLDRETAAMDNTTVTESLKSAHQSSSTVENSLPRSDEEHKLNMWEEVAFKYQQILRREYRMLNLPTYPVSGGSVYFYYVPVIISPQLVSHHDDINNSCDSKLKAANESSGKNADVIYISDDSDDDSIANVKKEPLEFEKSLEYSFGNRIKEENYNKRFISCEMEKKQISVINTEKNLVTVKLENEFDTNYPSTEFKQDTKIVSGEKRDSPNSREKKNEEQPAEAQYSSENKVEVREGHIRIIKGYTIEYHPMPSVGTMARNLGHHISCNLH